MNEKEIGYQKISELVARFDRQYASYKKQDYNETLTRRDFVDPFFKALGWDVDNSSGYAETYREVIHEDKVKVGKATKAPDYSFRLPGGKRLFFVEAKKPSVVVKDEILPAYQIRRYGWSGKLAISIITDFEEFAVYDCTKKPNPSDKASVARIKYLTFREYLKEFDFLWNTFSKEEVLKGSFDNYLINSAGKKGTSTVDEDFLVSLDKWRTYLATSISWNNKNLDEDEINFTVQQTLDRIIFLRIAEDRGIEPYGALKSSVVHGNYYNNLYGLFAEADLKYNSGLFNFNKDKLSKELKIDNKIIKTLINELYYPESPYEFSVLSVDILGSAYERFLGKIIRITPAHHAKIEEKPEVRKAGGVYYTPQYIVDYIVINTVGKLIKNKTPNEVNDLKILDPACGSGSFLLGAYQFLLEWHKKYYSSHLPASSGKGIKGEVLTPEGNLTTAEKKRILTNNIYGVDLDANAVEVTKLSLLLQCLEGETEASISTQLRLFNERILPSLDNNIKCGNSLVDSDFYDNQIEFGYEKKVKPFNWKNAFPEVFNRTPDSAAKQNSNFENLVRKTKHHATKVLEYVTKLENQLTTVNEPMSEYKIRSAFDAIIGNPPWVDLKGHPAELIDYYFKNFKTTENRINLFAIFIEKSLQLLSPRGKFGFIIPNSILYQSSYEKLRKHLIKNYNIETIVRLPDNTFKGVKAETVIITIGTETQNTECIIYEANDVINEISIDKAKAFNHLNPQSCLANEFAALDIFSDEKVKRVLRKIENGKTELNSLFDFSLGITPYDKYKGHTPKQIKERVFHSVTRKDEFYKPVLEGSDVERYYVKWSGNEYISYGNWLAAPRQRKFFIAERILIRQIISGKPAKIYAGLTNEELYNTQSVFNLVLRENCNINKKYVLGILNSTLMNFYHRHKFLDLSKRLFQKILIQNCKKLPIKLINLDDQNEKTYHDEIVNQVDGLLALKEKYHETKLETIREQLQTRIDYSENKIDRIIYKLYNLDENEIDLIESHV